MRADARWWDGRVRQVVKTLRRAVDSQGRSVTHEELSCGHVFVRSVQANAWTPRRNRVCWACPGVEA